MLEHIISQTPARVFQDEDVGDCVRAVLELCNCSAGAGYPALETQMVRAIEPWKSSFHLLPWTCGRSLLSAFWCCALILILAWTLHCSRHPQIRRLLNPLLWRRAPVDFQLQLLQTQIGYVRSSLAAAREILSVASILDTIRALYTHDQGTERQAQGDESVEGGEEEDGADASVSSEEYRAKSLIRVFRTSSFSRISNNDEFLALTRGGGEVAASRKDKEMLRTTALQVRTTTHEHHTTHRTGPGVNRCLALVLQIIICLCQEGVTEKDLRCT